MPLFDFEEYNRYLNQNDYNGAANYATKSYFKDSNQRAKMLDNIKILRNKGRVYNGMMERANTDQQQALAYKTAMENGTPLTTDNKYYKQYVDGVNNLFGTDAKAISIEFDGRYNKRYGSIPILSPIASFFGIKNRFDFLAKDEDNGFSGFDQFLANMGYSNDSKGIASFNKLGLKTETVNGKTRLTITKDNPNLYKVMMALNNVDTNHAPGSGNKALDDSIRGQKRFKLAGVDKNGKLIKLNTGANVNFNEANSTPFRENHPIMSASGLSDQELITSDRYSSDDYFINPDVATIHSVGNFTGELQENNSNKVSDQFGKIENVLYRTKNIEQELTKKREEDLSNRTMGETVTGSLGAAMSNLDDDLYNGLIDNETYSKTKASINQHYENLLAGADMTQYNVYASTFDEDDKTDTKHQLDTKNRSLINDVIAGALGSNRLKFSAAILGNMSGTEITVLPKLDKEGNPTGKAVRIFVENLFQGSVERSLARNTKLRAAKELNGMEYYGYRFTIPSLGDSEGGELSIEPGAQQASLTDKFGRISFVDKSKAQDLINRALILQDFIDGANQTFFNEDGQFVNNKNIEQEVSNWSDGATKELYNQTYQRALMLNDQNMDNSEEMDFLKNKYYLIKDYILNSIGYFGNEQQ